MYNTQNVDHRVLAELTFENRTPQGMGRVWSGVIKCSMWPPTLPELVSRQVPGVRLLGAIINLQIKRQLYRNFLFGFPAVPRFYSIEMLYLSDLPLSGDFSLACNLQLNCATEQ